MHQHRLPRSVGTDTSLQDPQRGSSRPDGACMMQSIIPMRQNTTLARQNTTLVMQSERWVGHHLAARERC